ncbi:hypothetical protein NNC19_16835 [Clostridium sp. SHJSY1]|uniref:hypothetical protein n=1 Tax=Clostridium sp. SHJSY1 TaxID=2942483 RepID=UPI0028760992|nr:hypothetical protein [Clostridium sp. SHJSY1]MDS0527358.1 hypothetical protein [Clostridium sp. SHJSY1]
MANMSIVNMVICACLILFTLIEVVSLLRAMNKKKGMQVFIHLLGVAATSLISYSVIKVIFGDKLDSSTLVMATAGISIVFFILNGFNSLFVVKKKKIKL